VVSTSYRISLPIVLFFIFAFSLTIGAEAQTSPSIASLSYPQDGASQVNPIVAFTWGVVSGAQVYYLYVGSAPGLKDIYDSGETTATALTARLAYGARYYARLFTKINNTWHAAPDISFTTVTTSVLLSPANQAAGLQPSVSFTWTPVGGASGYYLYVGTTIGAKDIVDSGAVQLTQLTRVLKGGTLYARIYTLINAHWYPSSDISFSVTAPPTLASLTSPANGSTLFNTSPVTLKWTTVPNATVYYLYLGTTPGAKDVINSGEIKATQLIRNLPLGTYYARIYTEIAQAWYASSDISFSVTGSSALTFPANGATTVDPYINFAWQPFPGANAYSLSVGRAPGASDAVAVGAITSTSYQISAPLQANTTYYAQLGTLQGGTWAYSTSSFTTGTGIAHLLSPADGAVNIDVFSKLNWTTVTDAQAYYVYVGSAQGLKDVYDSGEIATSSLAVSAFKPNTQYFIRLYTEKTSRWYSIDYSFTTGTGIAQMVYPMDKATDVDPALPFQWSSDPRALAYFVTVGTGVGLSDIYSSGETLDTSKSIPVPGTGTFYIRLSTKRAEGWKSLDSSFALGDFVAHMTNPGNQALADPFSPFTWTTVPDADAYYLIVGSTLGARDIYDSGSFTRNSTIVPNLVSGNTYFARLYTHRLNVWRSVDTTFLAGKGVATLQSPQDGDIISPFEIFSWSVPDSGADAYLRKVGTSPSTADVFYSGPVQQTSIPVAGLDFGKTYFVTLLTLKGNIWRSSTTSFTTLGQLSVPNLSQLKSTFYANIRQTTAVVRAMADANTNVALPGTPLDSLLKQNGLSLASCFQYAQVLRDQLRVIGINARLRGITLTGTSYESHTPMEYYDPFNQKWAVADPTFGILYFDTSIQTGQSVEEIQTLIAANDFADVKIIYVTPLNDSVLRHYYIDPLTLYLNVIPPDQNVLPAMQNSPSQFLREVPVATVVGQPGLYLFAFGDPSEETQVTLGDGPLTLKPVDSTQFSKAFPTPRGWTIDSAPSDLKAYIFIRPVF
jgi:hypothetical protein